MNPSAAPLATYGDVPSQTALLDDAVNYEVIDGDLLDQKADVIVNAWNRNVIPWWLLLPQGVSGAIKRTRPVIIDTDVIVRIELPNERVTTWCLIS